MMQIIDEKGMNEIRDVIKNWLYDDVDYEALAIRMYYLLEKRGCEQLNKIKL